MGIAVNESARRLRSSGCALRARRRGTTAVLAATILLAGLFPSGCGAPFGVNRSSPEKIHRSLTSNVISTGDLSSFSQIVLHRRNLTDAFEDDPESTLSRLREELRSGRLSDEEIFSLAELSFHHASRKGGQPHFLAAALYAYAYVFPENPQLSPARFDPRQRVAMDLYNRALTEAFEAADGEHVEIGGGTFRLPFGAIEILFDTQQLNWERRHLTRFYASAELEVVGFENRYRQPGIGAPLAAATEAVDPHAPSDFVGPRVRLPMTMVLLVSQPRQQILRDNMEAVLRLYAGTDGESVEIEGDDVPLEQEPTAALALTLTAARPWAQNLGVFLGKAGVLDAAPTFGGREPHRRGRIPVVFVHGTASNFSVWANMLNDLESDSVIRENFQFWFFRYDSGQPILYSGMQLRQAMTRAEATFRADGVDPCLQRMVVIGHSQGGLLVKLTAIESGDKFWRNLSDQPFDEVKLSDDMRATLRETMFVEPLPFVDRVIFIATPHRGSYLTGPGIVRRLAQRLISFPANLARMSADLLAVESIRRSSSLQRIPTSIDNMWPGNPFIKTVEGIPVDSRIKAHSIIGVTGDGPIEEGGDGVVKYASAHIDGVESELVVPYEHSMQAKPEVVAEVQRILHLHLELNGCLSQTDRTPDEEEKFAPLVGGDQETR